MSLQYNNEYTAKFFDKTRYGVSPLSYTSNTKTILP